MYFVAFVFCSICILTICILFFGILSCLHFVSFVFCFVLYFGTFAFCSLCILLHLYFENLYFTFCILSCLYFEIFAFCSIFVLFRLYFGVVFCAVCIMEHLYFVTDSDLTDVKSKILPLSYGYWRTLIKGGLLANVNLGIPHLYDSNH